jgi:hypothetical protein
MMIMLLRKLDAEIIEVEAFMHYIGEINEKRI